jgi:hypothetical protein
MVKFMSDLDRLSLSPLLKWNEFKRFPYRVGTFVASLNFQVVIQSLLLSLVALQIYIVSTEFTDFTRANYQTFENYFLPAGA